MYNKEALRKELEDCWRHGYYHRETEMKDYITTRLAALDDGDVKVVFGEWQLCPKCNGYKQVQNPFMGTVTGPLTIPCDMCSGSGKLAKPIIV